jgi:hypothetical protein
MPRVLLLAATTGYQTRAFGESAERLGVDLVYATDRCDVLEDPWQDGAIAIRFREEQESVGAILAALRERPVSGVVAVGDRPTVIAARVLEALGLPGHPPRAALSARNKRLTRERLEAAGLPTPRFAQQLLDADPGAAVAAIGFPAVVKPLALSGSRGVMRVNDAAQLQAAFVRLRSLLAAPELRAEHNPAHDLVLVEGFIEGREFAVEALMNHGTLDVLAVFDKPDPLDGPFFEETIYLTPSSAPTATQAAIVESISRAASALGLFHGPIHAECRANPAGVFVLEVAARPIGGLCARALRFSRRAAVGPESSGPGDISLEELLLRHALGESSVEWHREPEASGVMMIPIPRRGLLRGVSGLEAAQLVSGVEDIRITAKPDQLLVPLPEGASYLGFIFARSARSGDVEHALREAHDRIGFTIVDEVRVLQSAHGR